MPNQFLNSNIVLRSTIEAIFSAGLMNLILFYDFIISGFSYPPNPLGPVNPFIAQMSFILGYGIGFFFIWRGLPTHYELGTFLDRHPGWYGAFSLFFGILLPHFPEIKSSHYFLIENFENGIFMTASVAAFTYFFFYSTLSPRVKKAQSASSSTSLAAKS